MAMGDLVPRVYATFRGVDFRTDEVNLQRSPDSLNVWKDYKEVDSIRTRPGMELLESFNISDLTPFEATDAQGKLSIYRMRAQWQGEGMLEKTMLLLL